LGADHSASPAAYQSHVTKPGQRASFQLADGSSVLLAAGSTLRFAKDFGKESRDIYLEGHARFTVTKSNGAPFVVHAGNTAARVLGTSFTVRHYQEDTDVRVVVAEGRVALGQSVLSVGDMGVARSPADVSITREANIGAEFGWTDGRLNFDNVKLRNAIRDIERWYGITIDVRDPALLDKGITTTFASEPAAEAIALLASALEARGTIRGTHAVLTTSHHPSAREK
jgi:transmembrane sensor